MALTLGGLLRGAEQPRRQKLLFESAPEPPAGTGTPARAGEALTQQVLALRRPAIDAAATAARRARSAWRDG